jgi:hypothetical protein
METREREGGRMLTDWSAREFVKIDRSLKLSKGRIRGAGKLLMGERRLPCVQSESQRISTSERSLTIHFHYFSFVGRHTYDLYSGLWTNRNSKK